MLYLRCMRKHTGILFIMLGFCMLSATAQNASEPLDTVKRSTSLQIKVIKGGPCGDASQRVAQSSLMQDPAIHLDMACSCLRKPQEYLSEDF